MQSLHQHISLMPPLAFELNQFLSGFTLTEAFSQNNELATLVFCKDNEYLSVQFNTEAKTGLLFCYEQKIERSGSVYPLFKQLLHLKVLCVYAHAGNRSFAFDFENGLQLVFKLYGPLSNIILFEEGKVVGLFRKAIENDWLLQKDSFSSKREDVVLDVNPTCYYIYANETEGKRTILLKFEPCEFDLLYNTNSILEALTRFSRIFLTEYLFRIKKDAIIKKIQLALKRQQGLLQGAKTKLHHLKTQIPPDEIANILMANLQVVKKGETAVTLFDFYREQNIEIKLKKAWSPQENAEQYYKKSKNIKKDWAQAEEQIEKSGLLIAQLEIELEKANIITSLKEIKEEISQQDTKQPKVNLGADFKKFECEGYLIFVGKNSINNDQLTLKFAHKDDLWLHAKGVSGSHVIIKHKNKTGAFPKQVITYAAHLAAYYSKAKSSSLVPVIYTFKKFVRKPKGAHAGAVKVEKEELILVEPILPKPLSH